MADHEFHLPKDPIDGMLAWLDEAKAQSIPEHIAMTLSTVAPNGHPSARVVYFKGLSNDSLGHRCPRFFTNYESQKSKDMDANPRVSLLFYWPAQWRQVRIEGRAEKTSHDESETYFQTRERGSRIGAWASPQSHEIESRGELEKRVTSIEAKFHGQDIPCPPFWGGWRVVPDRFEFWSGGTHRLHDRQVFELVAGIWQTKRLAP